MNSKYYPFVFATGVCLVCSLCVSLAAVGLRPWQVENQRVDQQRNVLLALGVPEEPGMRLRAVEVEAFYEQHIQPVVIDSQGFIQPDMTPDQITAEQTDYQPLYLYEQGDQIEAIVIPVSGQGLWSAIYGYLAVKTDGRTILGLSFYQQGETPGLGAEIASDWFQNSFQGKQIFNKDNELVSVEVIKGKVAERLSEDQIPHAVDGISGATITSNSVTKLLKQCLKQYEPFLRRLMTGEEKFDLASRPGDKIQERAI